MKGCWDPEFEPSVEDIVDFGELALGGISLFSLAHGSGGHVRVNRLKTRAPIYACTEHAQFVDVSKFEFMAATFMRDSGRSL